MSAYGCFCDPGLPRPTADRGRGLRETVVTRPRKTYRNLGRKTVNKVAETTINPAVSELYEYIKLSAVSMRPYPTLLSTVVQKDEGASGGLKFGKALVVNLDAWLKL
ncbi:MAG: hypothetical protein QXG29_05940 [Sulfolobales archaeon]